MRIGIIGPTKIDTFCSIRNIMRDAYLQYVRYVATHLARANHEIFLVPDKESVAEAFGKYYREEGGKNLNVLIPVSDTEFGHSWLNAALGHHIVDTKTWRNTPEELDRVCDVLLCFGLGVGSMIEICYTKWYNVNHIYLLKEFVPKLPLEIAHKLRLNYVSTEEVVNILREQNVTSIRQ